MFISSQNRFVFIGMPRNGTHMVYDVLQERYEGYRFGEFFQSQVPPNAEDFFRFIVTRNPYTRFASAWTHVANPTGELYGRFENILGKKFNLLNFLDWLNENKDNLLKYREQVSFVVALMPMYQYIRQYLHSTTINAYVKLENFSSDFEKLPFGGSMGNLIPVVNTSSFEPFYVSWDSICSPDVIHAINHFAKQDFDLFDYKVLGPDDFKVNTESLMGAPEAPLPPEPSQEPTSTPVTENTTVEQEMPPATPPEPTLTEEPTKPIKKKIGKKKTTKASTTKKTTKKKVTTKASVTKLSSKKKDDNIEKT